MTLLDRYLIRRLAIIALFAILIFTISWLAPEIMFKAVAGISDHQLTFFQGVAYLIYQIPPVLTYCIPISALLGSVFLFRQMSLSSELTAILASGISFIRLIFPVAIVGCGLALLFFLTQEVLIPWSTASLRHLNQVTHFEGGGQTNPPQLTFVEKGNNGQLEKFLVISPHAVERQNQFIFLFFRPQGDISRVARMITAAKGQWIPTLQTWDLQDGIEYLLNKEGIYQEIHAFNRLDIHTSPVPNALLQFPTGNPAEFKVSQLHRYVRLLKEGGQTEDAKFYEMRLLQRYVLPLIPIILAIYGAGIGIERSRAKRNLGLTYAAGLLLLYNVFVPVSTTIGSIGILPTFIAALLPLVVTVLGGTLILELRKSEG